MERADLERLVGLARNPAAPEAVLLRILNGAEGRLRSSVFERAEVPDAVCDAAASHPDREVRGYLAAGAGASGAQRARLAGDPDPWVRRLVAAGPEVHGRWRRADPLPDEVCARLARDGDRGVRARLGMFAPVPDEVGALLLADPEAEVRASALYHWRGAPDAMVRPLLDDPDPAVRRAAGHVTGVVPGSAAEILEQVAAADSGWERRETAAGAVLTDRLAERLYATGDEDVRQGLAANPGLPDRLVRALASDTSPAVRLAVSLRPELTEEQRTAIDHHVGPDDILRPPPWVMRSLDDPVLMRACAESAHLGMRRFAAYSPHLPGDLVARLAADDDFVVRMLLCENHPEAPGELLLETLLASPFITRFDQLDRPRFPRVGLARFADSPDPGARLLVARDPEAPAELIEQLSHDPSAGVRGVMARDARLPVARLLELLHEPETAEAAAEGPALPLAAMESVLAAVGIP
ncbi:LRV domain-containing protein [Streptomyces sp. NPDC017448]|uniref:LRV domain-containing protein n=1 Tax=Streptomyces sp. NPDC017448 TaxID=3364996 RepID=UPI0037A8FF67